MSISDYIEHQIEHGLLLRHNPLLPSSASKRVLLLTQTLAAQLNRQSQEDEQRLAFLAADLDRFVLGKVVEVSMGRSNAGFLKRLVPGSDEVWTLRSQVPKPGVRVFGRFALTDVFVATNMAIRKDLNDYGSQAFNIEIQRCKAEWRKCFNSWPAHASDSISGYISENWLDYSGI